MSELHRPFPLSEHKWRVMAESKNNTGLVATYIDARNVMDRLDEVVSPEGWEDTYNVIDSGQHWTVACRLTVQGVTKEDVGDGDAAKDAYSDALKRAAVKFGVGRYLYSLDSGWYPIEGDGKYKRFTKQANQQIEQKLKGQLSRLGAPQSQQDVMSSGTLPEVISPDEIHLSARDDHEQHIDPGFNVTTGKMAKQPDEEDNRPVWAQARGFIIVKYPALLSGTATAHHSGTPASGSQYGLLTGVIDKLTGGQHNLVLSILCDDEINGGNPTSKAAASSMLNVLLEQHRPMGSDEYVDNPKFSPKQVENIKDIASMAADWETDKAVDEAFDMPF